MKTTGRRFRSIPIEAEDDPYAEDPRADYVPEDEPVFIARCRCGAALAKRDGWTMLTCFDCADPPSAA